MEKRTDHFVIEPDTRLDFLRLFQYLYEVLRPNYAYLQREIAVLCIGSVECIGDALGPLVGSELEAAGTRAFGTLEAPVHARSLTETLRRVRETLRDPIVIAVDACVGNSAEIGNVESWQGSLRAGLALGKPLPEVGDIAVVGIVGADSQANFATLRRAPLPTVMRLSKTISRGLAVLLRRVEDEKRLGR